MTELCTCLKSSAFLKSIEGTISCPTNSNHESFGISCRASLDLYMRIVHLEGATSAGVSKLILRSGSIMFHVSGPLQQIERRSGKYQTFGFGDNNL